MDNDTLAQVFATERVSTLAALTALVTALEKQPGMNKDKLIEDLMSLLPEDTGDPKTAMLAQWRDILRGKTGPT